MSGLGQVPIHRGGPASPLKLSFASLTRCEKLYLAVDEASFEIDCW